MSFRARLGDVEFSVVDDESPEYGAEISERSVERGADVTDHIRPRPITLALSGIVVGEDAAQKLQQLREYARTGAVLRYIGRNIFANMAIQSFPTSHTYQIRNGFSFRLELKEIRVAHSEMVAYVASDPATGVDVSAQTQPPGDAGAQSPGEDDVDEAQQKSWLSKIWDGVTSFLGKTDPASPGRSWSRPLALEE